MSLAASLTALWRALTGRWRENALQEDPWHRHATTGAQDATPVATLQRVFGLDGTHEDGLKVPLETLAGSGTYANAADAREEAWKALRSELKRAADLREVRAAADYVWWVPVRVTSTTGPARTETFAVIAADVRAAAKVALDRARRAWPFGHLAIDHAAVTRANESLEATILDRPLEPNDATAALIRVRTRHLARMAEAASATGARVGPFQGHPNGVVTVYPLRIRGEDVWHSYDQPAAEPA